MGKAKHRPRFAPVRLNNQWVIEYAADPSGVLRIEPAEVRAEIAFDFTYRSKEAGEIFYLLFRLADAEGRLWQARVDPSPRLLTAGLVDLSRREPAHFERCAPERFRQAFDKKRVLLEAFDLLDDRFYRYFVLDDMAFILNFKYQGPGYEIVVLDERLLLVRASGFFGSWNRHRIPAPGESPAIPIRKFPATEEEDWDDEEDEDEGDYDNAPPIYYTMRLRDFLAGDQVYPCEENRFGESDISRPLRFGKVRGKGEPQSAVTFRPSRSAVSPLGPPATESRLVPISLSNDPEAPPENTRREVVFPTAESGDLVITAPNLAGTFRLGFRHRDAVRDVLSCVFRVPDSDGNLWEAETVFTPEVFLEQLVTLQRTSWAVFESTTEEDTQIFKEHLLLSGIRDTLDDGSRRLFLVADNAIVDVTFDNQKVTYDVAGQKGLLVRVSGLTGRVYPAAGDREYVDVDLSKHAEGERAVPPIVFPLEVRSLIFRNTTFCVDEGYWHRNDLPLPLIFHRVPGTGEPQADVVFRPGGVASGSR
ncbi:MAG TPA: hypothetical protein VKD72_22925 [Gemmataceae bacterium]|nr:hypothetical protein [Gemmataceae bacterium]